MKIKIEVDVDDLIESYDGAEVMIKDYIDAEIMKIVKKDIRYKAFIQRQADNILKGLK